MADQTQLALVGGASTTPNVFAPFSRAATAALLRTGIPSKDKIDGILRQPDIHAEIQRLAPDLATAALPCGGEYVRTVLLARVAPVTGVPWENEAAGRMALAEYEKALGDLPAEALHRAVDEFHKTPEGKFGFPRPGVLHDLAKPHEIRLRSAAWLARAVSERQATAAKKISSEDRSAEIARLKAEGILNEDGTVNLTMKTIPPAAAKTGETRSEMAERTRRLAAELEARKTPPSDEVIV